MKRIKMNIVVSNDYSNYRSKMIRVFKNFKNEGTLIGNGKRNVIKFLNIKGVNINFKSFKQPNIINRNIYRYFRKSKAKRSYEYAHLLISKNFNTPQPIAYMECYNIFGLTRSFYVSEHLEDCFTLRDIIDDIFFIYRERIIREYTKLIYQLHENGIEFIDNLAGNFLIKRENDNFTFFLVDLNRMNFHKQIKISTRLKNLSRITNNDQIINIISAEYAQLSGLSAKYCFDKIKYNSDKLKFKRKLKNKLKFYEFLKLKGRAN